jgi:ubiquinone/menaquinone biosynthesis C-methylase UbiE
METVRGSIGVRFCLAYFFLHFCPTTPFSVSTKSQSSFNQSIKVEKLVGISKPYNGLAARTDLLDPEVVRVVSKLRSLPVDGFPNDGWDDHWARRWEFPFVTSAIMNNLSPGASVMESGSGITPVPFWMANAALRVTGVDLEQSLADKWARVKVSAGSATFAVGDMLNLPFADSTFDGSYSISAMEHTGNAPRAVSELIRVTQPGGIIAFTMDIDIWNTDSVAPEHLTLVQDQLSTLCVNVYPYRYFSPSDLLTFTNRTIKPQSGAWIGLKQFLSGLGLYKKRDQCIFFYCGRKK